MKLHSAIFYTKDLTRIVEFYSKQLGMEIEYVQEGRFASFLLGASRLGIKQAKESREVPGHQTIFVETEDINSFYENLKRQGIVFSKELVEEDWATNFALLDPDRNKVLFVEKNLGSNPPRGTINSNIP